MQEIIVDIMKEDGVEKELKIFTISAIIVIWGQTFVAYLLAAQTAFEINAVVSVIATLLLYSGYRMIKIMM